MEAARHVVRGTEGSSDPVEDREQRAWEQRPFARTFDLIAEQYGWTDDQILDLTMERIAQVREVIWERKRIERHRDLVVREAELRILTQFIAAGQQKDPAKAAASVRLRPDEVDPDTGQKAIDPSTLPSTASVMRMFGGAR